MSGILAALIASSVRPVSISGQNANTTVPGGSAVARYRLNNTGVAQRSVAGVLTNISNEWLRSGTASNFDARGTFGGAGGTTSGPTTYTNLGTSQEWSLSITGADASRTVLIEIVRTGTTSPVLASATMTLDALGAP